MRGLASAIVGGLLGVGAAVGAEAAHAADAAPGQRFQFSAVVRPVQPEAAGRFAVAALARATSAVSAPAAKASAGESCAQATGGIFYDGFEALSGALEAQGVLKALNLIGGCWSSAGDAGSDPSLQFLGTLDAQPLVLRVRNVPAARFEPSLYAVANAPISANVIQGSAANLIGTDVYGASIGGGGLPAGDSDPILADEGPNRVLDAFGSVGGGHDNQAGDGAGNLYDRAFARVGGGRGNRAEGGRATVLGGSASAASALHASVAGGSSQVASGTAAVIGGGAINVAQGGVILGGSGHESQGGSIGGGMSNVLTGSGRIGGGSSNTIDAGSAVVLGGLMNRIDSSYGVILGGRNISLAGSYAVGAGFGSNETGTRNSVAGQDLAASGTGLSLLGGNGHFGGGNHSVIGGGQFNRSGGVGSTTSGYSACAMANWSFAGGRSAQVRGQSGTGCVAGTVQGDIGTFLWSDTTSAHTSNGPNQFLVFAGGGMAINAGSPQGNRLRINGLARIDQLGTSGAASLCRNATQQIASCSSSRRYKQDIVDLENAATVLAALRPVGFVWTETGKADIGFVAEEVAQADARLVVHEPDGHIEGVRYDRVFTLLVAEVQSQAHLLSEHRSALREAMQVQRERLTALAF